MYPPLLLSAPEFPKSVSVTHLSAARLVMVKEFMKGDPSLPKDSVTGPAMSPVRCDRPWAASVFSMQQEMRNSFCKQQLHLKSELCSVLQWAPTCHNFTGGTRMGNHKGSTRKLFGPSVSVCSCSVIDRYMEVFFPTFS